MEKVSIPASYHGPKVARPVETRKRRKQQSANAGQSFRSRQSMKDPFDMNGKDPWGLRKRMGPPRVLVAR